MLFPVAVPPPGTVDLAADAGVRAGGAGLAVASGWVPAWTTAVVAVVTVAGLLSRYPRRAGAHGRRSPRGLARSSS
ncbi:hypothetical protein GCM10010116_10590 [Microbispora rosea subsp. aerata]|nr:hypothetical protein [Microbispora rosea]GGO05425.1 hypothetical protein GCM10010116_10590 [Microbispora rosea subsp. aerata]GIH57245.1 hypothetical protein Mro02_41590 [Microbispora rosea subsp. aerata]GLJ83386.1 hypothetical protein GCM10017588_21140 [Microbispora rosea subsp. aerata]